MLDVLHLKEARTIPKMLYCLLQVILPENAIYRSGHTTTAIWSSNRSVMVVVDGGQRGDDKMICDIRIIYIGELILSTRVMVYELLFFTGGKNFTVHYQ